MCIADVPPWGRGEEHEEKRRGGSGAAAAASPVTGRSSRSSRQWRKTVDRWMVTSISLVPRTISASFPTSRESLDVLFPRLLFDMSLPPSPPSPPLSHACTWRLRRDSMRRLTRPRVALCASGFISVKNIYWFRKKKNTTAWRIRRFYRVIFFSDLSLARLSRLSWERATRYTCMILKI